MIKKLPSTLLIFFLFTCFLKSSAFGHEKFVHRGYLGWMVDFSSSTVTGAWPSIQLDSTIYADYIEALDFLQQSEMNEITLWGLFTNESWEPEIATTISTERKILIQIIIGVAHDRNFKVMCGMGVYSWGFGKIIAQNPDIACSCNGGVLDFSKREAWSWQQKMIDYVMDNFEFDGISIQSGYKGWCPCDQNSGQSEMQYHAMLNQKALKYIRSRRPDYLIGICGWGMNMSNPNDFEAIVAMTREVDCLIDVGEREAFAGREYRQKLIKSMAPCLYGNTAIPNIEPIQSIKRNAYFIPTVFATGGQLKHLYEDGGRACEAYARTRGNPGDRVTIEVIARLLSDTDAKIRTALSVVLEKIYAPKNEATLLKLVEIFEGAEKAFFDNNLPFDEQNQYSKVILLMERGQQHSSVDYFKNLNKSQKKHMLKKSTFCSKKLMILKARLPDLNIRCLIKCFYNNSGLPAINEYVYEIIA